jgi:hypothetical protein
VAHPDRIQRSETRRDSGRESAFARTLRRRREDDDSQEPPKDGTPEWAAVLEQGAAAGKDAVDGPPDDGAPRKLVDVRV